jgi:hypothetical protein
MEMEIFTVCDYSADIANKLIIVGTFDMIMAKSFPAIHPSFSVAARLRFSREELGEHKFKILFVDEKSNNFLPPIEGTMNVKPAPSTDHATVNLSINIGQPKFPQPGKYSVQFHLDEKWKTGLTIYLIKQ